MRRYEQYLDALADDRAFQREWMIPIVAGSRLRPTEVTEDWGVRPIVREELEALLDLATPGLDDAGMHVSVQRMRASVAVFFSRHKDVPAILLDATLVRLVMLPAILVLMGDKVWWPWRPRPVRGEVVAEPEPAYAGAYLE